MSSTGTTGYTDFTFSHLAFGYKVYLLPLCFQDSSTYWPLTLLELFNVLLPFRFIIPSLPSLLTISNHPAHLAGLCLQTYSLAYS